MQDVKDTKTKNGAPFPFINTVHEFATDFFFFVSFSFKYLEFFLKRIKRFLLLTLKKKKKGKKEEDGHTLVVTGRESVVVEWRLSVVAL